MTRPSPAHQGPPAPLQVDHLVVAADTLAQGVAWCEATLGVTPGPGGRHALMGTHNRLLKIASAGFPDAYLEIIAIDPDAPPPGRARWFGLDAPGLRQRLRDRGPGLIHAVARSTMLDVHRTAMVAAALQPGEPVAASRDTPQGRLEWRILLRDDGALDAGGAVPTLLQWTGRHPAQAMPDSGVALAALVLCGVPQRAHAVLQLPGVEVRAAPGPALRATFLTPQGPVMLESA
jgi:Glyoxalase-like domain